MGRIIPPQPVKLIVGMFCREPNLFKVAEHYMESLWGPIDIHSKLYPFDKTHYYDKEMGPNLVRKFISFTALIDPGGLARIKHQTNELEDTIAGSAEGRTLSVRRPINLDSGYIEPSKLVLATTKNFSHRIYIGDRIYAEVTLHYANGWKSWPFTFPDYGSGAYNDFLDAAREKLLEQLKGASNNCF